MSVGCGFAMRVRVARLAREYGVPTPSQILTPCTAPRLEPPFIVTGLASTTALDCNFSRFDAFAFAWPIRLDEVKLLHKHDPARVIGRILGLRHDAKGNLWVRARVEDAIARDCDYFSVGATITRCHVEADGTPDFRGVVQRCDLTEITMTTSPSNGECVVQTREPIPDWERTADDLVGSVKRAQAAIERLREICNAAPATPPTPAPTRLDAIAPAPAYILKRRRLQPPNDFQRLIYQMSKKEEFDDAQFEA